MTDFSAYAARLKSGNPDIFLGSLAWYSVSESVHLTHDKLRQHLTTAGLPVDGVAPPRDDDVFRRVCSAAQRKRVGTGTGTFLNILVRDVVRQNNEVHKQVVIEEVDGGNKRLSYEATHKIVFANGAITVEEIVPNAVGATTVATIEAQYLTDRNSHNAYAIRELIRRELTSAKAALVRPTGGVYFVMRQNASTLDAVMKLGELVDGASIHALPLIDDAKQRTMIKEAVQNETVLEIDRRLGEIDGLLNGPEISTSRFQSLMTEMKSLTEKTEAYSDLLEDTLDGAEKRVKVLKAKMRKLFDHVK